jgi:hypothetical protein
MRVRSLMHLQKLRRINPMTSSTSSIINSHQQIRLLLPWYVNQSLQPEERESVERHIRHCLLCRQELVSLEQLAKTFADATDSEMDADASFANLYSKLPRKAVNKRLSSPSANSVANRWAKLSRQSYITFAVAASLLLAVIPLTLYTGQTITADNYYTLSDKKSPAATGKELRIVFSKSLSDAEIDAILAKIHGRRIEGPNRVGAFTVGLDNAKNSPDQVEAAIALLRSQQDVLLAEPVAQP